MRRFWRWLVGLFHRTMDKLEDPEMMLDQARRDMQQALTENREKAVQAITQKNRLENMLNDARRKSQELESKAIMALKQGNRELARSFVRERANNDSVIGQLDQSYAQASAAVESVKVAVKRQEEEVRRKTAEALAMKAQWKQAQIQNSITKALEGLTFENQFESFGAAKERIQNMQAEAAARQEMFGTSIQGKIMDMEDKALDYEAEEELKKLEERLGLGESKTATADTQEVKVGQGDATAPVEAPPSEIDQQLDELEKRINPGG